MCKKLLLLAGAYEWCDGARFLTTPTFSMRSASLKKWEWPG